MQVRQLVLSQDSGETAGNLASAEIAALEMFSDTGEPRPIHSDDRRVNLLPVHEYLVLLGSENGSHSVKACPKHVQLEAQQNC
jgi:hypothetical protein